MFRASLMFGLMISFPALAQTTVPAAQPMKGVLLEGVGNHHHPISTSSPEAQKFFDQGLNLVFGFNHDEAMRSFSRAIELDPQLAMGHWGLALALGPNYNVDVDPPREKAAYDEIQKALQLSARTSPPERDYITALARRYSADPKADLKQLGIDYAAAMRDLSGKYPDDLDAAVLYAESLMDLHPWQLWTHDGKPGENTGAIVATLESVLKRNPDHIGANHLYIHAVEASPSPERALEAAARLPNLAPASGHLVHMPAHIYGRTGDHSAAAGSNAAAVAADQAYFKNRDDGGIYPMMYYNHNLHFLAYSHSMQGRFADAKSAADQLAAHAGPHVQHMPMLEAFAITPALVLARFQKWDEILKLPDPGRNMPLSQLTRHFTRALALASTAKPDAAQDEMKQMDEIGKSFPADATYGPLNSIAAVVALSDNYLTAKISLARGDVKSAINSLTKAAEQEDALIYDEPPSWWLHVRESLGSALLRDNRAGEAEAAFRRELDWNPRSGRALLGLAESLRKQGKAYDAQWVQQEFEAAWKDADTQVKTEGL